MSEDAGSPVIYLIDSESEENENGNGNGSSSIKQTTTTTIITTDTHIKNDDERQSGSENDEDEGEQGQPPRKKQQQQKEVIPSSSDEDPITRDHDHDHDHDHEQDHDQDHDQGQERHPMSIANNEHGVFAHDDSDSDLDSDSDSDTSGPESVSSEGELGEVNPQSIIEARQFLKKNGPREFINNFIPVTAGVDDLLKVVASLGFKVKVDGFYDDEDKMAAILNFLERAMNKVLKTRYRLENFNTIDQFCEKLLTSKNILVLTGAGISTSIGIPDFRSSQGFYSKIQNFGLSDPQDVFDLDEFKYDPELFYSIAHMILPPEGAFTPLHGFIKLLQDKGKLLRNYTQNIDNLEGNVGIDPEKLVQCHGSFATATCITCGFKVPGTSIYKEIRAKEVPLCPWCKNERKTIDDNESGSGSGSFGVMKPDITFFGEALPKRFHDMIPVDREKCDLLICIGTSLKVAPVSEIVNTISADVPQILINKDPVTHCEFDVNLLGYCDQVISYICDKLGWQIDHPDYTKIVQNDLKCDVVDEMVGCYEISDRDYREKQQAAEDAAAEAAAAAADAADAEIEADGTRTLTTLPPVSTTSTSTTTTTTTTPELQKTPPPSA